MSIAVLDADLECSVNMYLAHSLPKSLSITEAAHGEGRVRLYLSHTPSRMVILTARVVSGYRTQTHTVADDVDGEGRVGGVGDDDAGAHVALDDIVLKCAHGALLARGCGVCVCVSESEERREKEREREREEREEREWRRRERRTEHLRKRACFLLPSLAASQPREFVCTEREGGAEGGGREGGREGASERESESESEKERGESETTYISGYRELGYREGNRRIRVPVIED